VVHLSANQFHYRKNTRQNSSAGLPFAPGLSVLAGLAMIANSKKIEREAIVE
jgi:hypothetical protein